MSASNPVDVEIDLTRNESDTSRRSDSMWQLKWDVCVLYSNSNITVFSPP